MDTGQVSSLVGVHWGLLESKAVPTTDTKEKDMVPMNFDQFLVKVLVAFPNAQVGEDNDGQLIIHTNLTRDENEMIVAMPEVES